MSKATRAVLILLAIEALAGAVLWLVLRPKQRTDAETQAPPEPAVNVVVSTIAATSLPDAILLPASVEPYKSVAVAAEVSGAVEWIGAEEGSQVREGQEIARIDRRTLQALYDQAKASAEFAKSDFARVSQLFEEKAASEEELQRARATLGIDEALLEAAEVQLAKSAVTAPVAGILNRRYIEKGEYVKAGDPVADVVQVDRVKVVVDVPEKDVNHVPVGTMLGILPEGGAEKALAEGAAKGDLAAAIQQSVSDRKIILGTVTYRSVVADEKTRTYRVEVAMPNPGLKLLPGMIVRAVVLRRVIGDAVAVPLVAVVPRDGRAVVYVENDSRADERTVELGITDGVRIQILSGVKPGEKLIVEGQRQLRDGSLVKVIEPQGAAQ